jgi:hypothetical protein
MIDEHKVFKSKNRLKTFQVMGVYTDYFFYSFYLTFMNEELIFCSRICHNNTAERIHCLHFEIRKK